MTIRWTVRERVAMALAGLGVLAAIAGRAQCGVAGKTLDAPASAPYADWDRRLDGARRVPLNSASAEELTRLPRIGPSLAARMVAERQARGPFADVEDIVRVRGIGPATVEAIREYMIVQHE